MNAVIFQSIHVKKKEKKKEYLVSLVGDLAFVCRFDVFRGFLSTIKENYFSNIC